MTQTSSSPDTERLPAPNSAQTAPRSVLLAVALVSFASLLLELAMTRLFSVVLFYHFAFFAISVALLGLGSGGVFAHVRRGWLGRFATGNLGTALCILNSLCIPAVVWVVLHTPVSLQVNWTNFGKLTIIYLATAVPFFFTGLLFSVLFARSQQSISILYGADLAGGAVACLAVVPMLNSIGAPTVLLCCSVAMALAGCLWAGDRKMGLAARGLVVLAAALAGWSHYSGKFDVIYAKGVLRDPQWVEFAKWNAISRIEVNNQNGARYVVIDADATTAIMNVDPAKWGEDQTSTLPSGTGIPAVGGFNCAAGQGCFNWKKNLMAAAPAVANVLRPQGAFAIIGPGGGVDVLRAVANGSPSVTGIEINPTIVNSVMRGRYTDYSYHLYDRPQVHIHVQDGRSFIRSSREQYDVVQMTLVDTWASTAAGAFALSENNLYTLEAFREYFDHLKPDGMIAITRWEFRQPPAPDAMVKTPEPTPETPPSQAAPSESTPAASQPRVAVARPPASIWRQPGGGGGLQGGGRGGVEGEPVPLDTPEPKYQDYFNKVRERIKSKWVYPRPAGERGIEGELLIEFHIAKDGRLEYIELRHSSGTQILDDAALTAVKLAQPFPPVPDDIAKVTLAINGQFRYQIVSGFVNQFLR